jgi:hypothetical protein
MIFVIRPASTLADPNAGLSGRVQQALDVPVHQT